MPDYERPDACPKEGENEQFDAGWNAHRAGISKKTVDVLTGGFATIAWEAREYMAGEEALEPAEPAQLTIEDELGKEHDEVDDDRGRPEGSSELGPHEPDA